MITAPSTINDLLSTFSSTVLSEAKKFLGCKENPGTPNRSKCVDEIKEMGGWTVTNEPWCAQFVYAVTDRAAKLFKIENILPKTKSTRVMLSNSKKNGIRVDKKPAVGSIFFIPRGDNGTQGHVGFLSKVEGNSVYTVEGNLSDSVDKGKRTISSSMEFIHIEEMTDKKVWPIALKIGIPVLLTGAAWYGAKKIF